MIKISKIATIVAAIIVGGAFFSLASGLWNPAWNPFKPVSNDIFIEALGKSLAAGSFNLSGLLEIEAETATAIKISLEAQEQIDKTDPDNIKANAQINLGMETEGISLSGIFEARGFGDRAYFKIVSLPSFLPLPVDMEQIKGQWIKLNFKDLQDKLAAAGWQLADDNGSQDFHTILKNLQEIAADKKLFETRKISGQHYSVALDKRAVKDFIPVYLDLAEKYAPEDQKEEVRQQLSDIRAGLDANFDQYWELLGGLNFEIWLEQGTGKLVKFVWEKEIDPAVLGNAQQDIKKMKLRLELGLSQFNEKFDIEEPADFKTAQEVVGGLAGQLAPATSTDAILP